MAAWKEEPEGVWRLILVPKFVTLWVIKIADGFLVRVNGTEVQQTYPTFSIACQVARKAAQKLNLQLTEALK